MPDHPLGEEIFPYIQSKPPLLQLELKESKLDTKPSYFYFIDCVKTAKRIGEPKSLHVFQFYHQTTKDISSQYETYHGENCFPYKMILAVITGISSLTPGIILPYFAALVLQVLSLDSFLNH